MRKKYESHYYPVTMIGGFFEEDYLLDFKELVMKDKSKTPILDYISKHIEKYDLSMFPEYAKGFTIIYNKNFNENPGESNGESGFFIGVNIFSIPEHISIKRARIDIRSALVTCGLVDPDAHTDSITLFSDVLKLRLEKDDV